MIRDYSKNKIAQGVINLAHAINERVKAEHGERYAFNLQPRHNGSSFKTKNLKGETIEVRINAVIPTEEIFAISQELVRAADEPFAAREIFEEDTSFHPGAREIGFDVLSDSGEGGLVAIGELDPTLPRADVRIDRNFQPVAKIGSVVSITRDDIQALELRTDRGLSPLVDLMTEKLTAARKNIERTHDRLIWKGAEIKGQPGRIKGIDDFMSTNPADYDGDAPSKGKVESVTGGDWGTKTSDQIIADLAKGFAYISRNNTYKANTLVLPPEIMIGRLSFRRTSDVDSTPLIEWIQRAARLALGRELKIVASNAMSTGTITGKKRPVNLFSAPAFMLLDSSKSYQAIATVEPLTMLAPVTNEHGTITQVMQTKTAGIQVKHPSTMYAGTGI